MIESSPKNWKFSEKSIVINFCVKGSQLLTGVPINTFLENSKRTLNEKTGK